MANDSSRKDSTTPLEYAIGNNPTKVLLSANARLNKDINDDEKLENYYKKAFALSTLILDNKVIETTDLTIPLAEKAGDNLKACFFKILRYGSAATNVPVETEIIYSEEAKNCALENKTGFLEGLYFSTSGNVLLNKGALIPAAEKLEAALEAYTKAHHQRGIFQGYLDLSLINLYTNDNNQAENYLNRAKSILDSTNIPTGLHDLSHYNFILGELYLYKNEHSNAQDAFNKTLKLASQYQNSIGLIYIHSRLAYIERTNKNLEKALIELEKAKSIAQGQPNRAHLFSVLLEAAEIELLREQPEQAANYIKQAKESLGSNLTNVQKGVIIDFERRLSAYLSDYKNAYDLMVNWLELQQVIYKDHQDRNIKEMNHRFNYKLQKSEKELLEAQNLSQKLEIEKQQTARNFNFSLVVLFALLSVFAIYAFLREKKVKSQLAKLALTDELTTAPNRRFILDALEKELHRSQRYNFPFSIAIIDLDHFKQINDDYGHQKGDEVLIQFAQICQLHLRADDFFGRFGGEEWLLIFPHTHAQECQKICHRISHSLSEKDFLASGKAVTFSTGITSIQQTDKNVTDLIKRADLALYQAKDEGRNRSVIL